METIGRRWAHAYRRANEDQLPFLQNVHELFIGPNATLIYGSLLGADCLCC